MSLPVLRDHLSSDAMRNLATVLRGKVSQYIPKVPPSSATTRDCFSSTQPWSRVLPFSIYVPSLHLKDSGCYEQGLELEFFTPSGDIPL